MSRKKKKKRKKCPDAFCPMDENLSPLRFGDLNSDRIYCMRENGMRGGKIICDYLSIDLNVLFFNSCFFFFIIMLTILVRIMMFF